MLFCLTFMIHVLSSLHIGRGLRTSHSAAPCIHSLFFQTSNAWSTKSRMNSAATVQITGCTSLALPLQLITMQ